MLGASHDPFRTIVRRSFAYLLLALALAPVVFVGLRVAQASRNVVYWDEFDTALSLVLQLDAGVSLRGFFERLFALANEHRMVTSRLMFAASYWLTGTVNFSVINWVGNAALVVLCVVLVGQMGTVARGVRLALLLAMALFQLEHYENFLWSGSSIDHFQVVLFAVLAIVGLARGTRGALLGATLAATLASFTLAHGMVTWLVGAGMLAQSRRWRAFAGWSVVAALVVAGFLAGFQINTAQRFADPTLAGLLQIARFWLALLGAVPAMGQEAIAPWLGGGLLAALAWVAQQGALRRERVALPVAVFAIGALAMIAVGRAAEAGGEMHSRYYVLSALAWALVAFMALSRVSHPRRPYPLLWGAVPVLVAFNLAANLAFAHHADSWIECRDRAALRFKQHGADGHGPFKLHPVPAHSTALLDQAERRGVYRMPPVCEPRSFPHARETSRITYYIDAMSVSPHAAFVAGWAALPGAAAKRGQIHLVLRSESATHVFSTVTITRPDVATATKHPEWVMCGFRFVGRRDQLPTGEFQVGLLIKDGRKAEYTMTAHRLRLIGPGQALLAIGD